MKKAKKETENMSKVKKYTKLSEVADPTLIVRAEGSTSPAKKDWIYSLQKLPKESKLKLRKEIEGLNKRFEKKNVKGQ